MRHSARRSLASVRTRIVASFVLLLLFATAIAVLAVRQTLLVRLDQRVESSLTQEIEEFTILAENGTDPETGERFEEDNLEALFRTFLGRNIPQEGEQLLAFSGSSLLAVDPAGSDGRSPLQANDALMRRWGTLSTTETGSVGSSVGPARYIAVPVRFDEGDEVAGRFVVVNFTDPEQEEVEEAVLVFAVVGVCVLLIGSVLAFFAAGRVLKPVRDLDETATAITETDLARRIQVSGHDELAELGRTFNTMVDRLESAFQSQREFIRDAGHELRTPLTIVRGHLELLDDDPVERQKTIELVTDELDRMSRFVADLAVLAKAERPDFLQFETIDLGTLGSELLLKAQPLGERDWQLDAGGGGVVVGDRQRLTEAVMNLAENAAAQTAAGERVTLGYGVSGGWAQLWVEDSGPGIGPRDRELIFERFKRGSGGSRYSGSGLGLAIVRAIADAHGGEVTVESELRRGSRFTLRVPVEQRGEGAHP